MDDAGASFDIDFLLALLSTGTRLTSIYTLPIDMASGEGFERGSYLVKGKESQRVGTPELSLERPSHGFAIWVAEPPGSNEQLSLE